uniref:Uncharacterized protein n=1 Tax=Ascaris lumbricoides TaxID=6252 RepID=A0A9J2PHR8_ASCLU
MGGETIRRSHMRSTQAACSAWAQFFRSSTWSYRSSLCVERRRRVEDKWWH